MGNRAIITTKNEYENNGFGVYLHWNGGRDSVEGFLTYCRLKGYRCENDPGYCLARLTQVICNSFGGSLSVGIVPARCGAGDDNGVYLIGDNWHIVGRREFDGPEQDNYPLLDFVLDVNDSQPAGEQIPERILRNLILQEQHNVTYEDKVALCKEGTNVAVMDNLSGEWKEFVILGFGDSVVNGQDRTGQPFYNHFHYGTRWTDPVPDTDIEKIKNNPNCYITKNTTFCFC